MCREVHNFFCYRQKLTTVGNFFPFEFEFSQKKKTKTHRSCWRLVDGVRNWKTIFELNSRNLFLFRFLQPKYLPPAPKREGYEYPKPAIRFELPQSTTKTTTTTPAPQYLPPKSEGYSYPKPSIPFELPKPTRVAVRVVTTTTQKPAPTYLPPRPPSTTPAVCASEFSFILWSNIIFISIVKSKMKIQNENT